MLNLIRPAAAVTFYLLWLLPAAAQEECTNVVAEVQSLYEVGRTTEITERFYAISPERRLKHPAVVLITDAARSDLFNGPGRGDIQSS